MLNSKDAAGFLAPLARAATRLQALTIPGEANALPAAEIAAAARAVGIEASEAATLDDAIAAAVASDPGGRVVICGSLHLAGHVLRLVE